jgi:hypothetical protein
MPWEYKALLDLENEGYCKKFADDAWKPTWVLVTSEKAPQKTKTTGKKN